MDFTKIDWKAVLPKFGVDPRCLTKKQGPCPICAARGVPVGEKNVNKDRFRFDNFQRKGNYYCNACGSGNAMQLMRACSGMADADIMARLQELTGLKSDDNEVVPIQVETEMSEEEVRRNRPKLAYAWNSSVTMTASDPVGRYLSFRVPGCDLSKLCHRYIRYNRSMRFYETEIIEVNGKLTDRDVLRGAFPVMLLRAIDGERKPITLHRTYLTKEGRKAPFKKVKKQMKGVRKLKGAAIPVCDVPESRILGVCEGYETGVAIATGYHYSINVWALLNAGNLAMADIPKGMFDKVIIFADHDKIDPKYNRRPGEHAAKQLQARLMELGIPCEIRIPPKEETDFADVWVEYYNAKFRSQPYFEQAPARTQPTMHEDQECHLSTPITQQRPPANPSQSKWAGIDQ